MLGILVTVGAGLVLGYVLVVACSLAGTIAVASAAPHFVAADHHLRPAYKLLHEALWTVASVGGGIAAASISGSRMLAWMSGAALAAALIVMLWVNAWEARQRGLPHQLLITLLTCAGVAGGILLRVR